MSKTVTLRLDEEVYQRFRSMAERDNRPLSNFIENSGPPLPGAGAVRR